MTKLRNLLRCYAIGMSIKSISSAFHLSCNTVRKYVRRYDAIGDQAVADAVLDRIVHSSHRIELFGESIRKMKAKK